MFDLLKTGKSIHMTLIISEVEIQFFFMIVKELEFLLFNFERKNEGMEWKQCSFSQGINA